MTSPRTINIGPYSFTVTPGYSAGEFAVGETELEVLDIARAERIRKKGFKVLEKLRAKSGRRTLSEGELRALTSAVAEFDREVKLDRITAPSGADRDAPGRSPRMGLELLSPDDPSEAPGEFDAEVARLAELRVAAEEANRGIKLDDAKREAALRALREDPILREAARVRVEAGLSERERMLSELF